MLARRPAGTRSDHVGRLQGDDVVIVGTQGAGRVAGPIEAVGDTDVVLEDASVSIDCPRCTCKLDAPLSRVIVGAGVFCPACQVHISFTDERAGVKAADKLLEQLTGQASRTIDINFEL